MSNEETEKSNPRQFVTAGFSLAALAVHLILRLALNEGERFYGFRTMDIPLILALILGGIPLVWDLLLKVFRREFGADFLAGISIVTAILLEEYLAGCVIVLMLSGGEALEAMALKNASSVLNALSKRMPSVAHVKRGDKIHDIDAGRIEIGDVFVIYPHEFTPVDGTVLRGSGSMDESFLTGEPYVIEKVPGSKVISGSVNGHEALEARAEKKFEDSRYMQIMQVMKDSQQRRPRMRRIADSLGAWYTPLSLMIAVAAWLFTGDPLRFLSVLMIATPCPLLIGIPTAIIGSISLSARRGIIVKDPVALEKISTCKTAIFDKTGTLTAGVPVLTDIIPAPDFGREELIRHVASLEKFSKHPLAFAVLAHARKENIDFLSVGEIREKPGEGLTGTINQRKIFITNRRFLEKHSPELAEKIPDIIAGMECVVLFDEEYAGLLRFRDVPRSESEKFVKHLSPKHNIEKIILLSGDRESEVRYLARQIGIESVFHGKTPEEKLEIVREETAKNPTLYVGDGINDAPALTEATVGVAFGQGSDITSQAAGAVILESFIDKIDELIHIGARMRAIALQSALGGIFLSVVGMGFAAFGYLNPVESAILMEVIDLASVLNAVRASFTPKKLTDFLPLHQDGQT